MQQLYYVSQKYTPNYVLETLQKQISIDLSIIQRTLHQRMRPELQFTLLTADVLAEKTIEKAAKYLPKRKVAVLSYLDRKVETRLLPYADIALIGMPYSATNATTQLSSIQDVTTDFVAIPHEIGHFLFQYGEIAAPQEAEGNLQLADVIKLRFSEQYAIPTNDWRLQWLEEIFADAYNCLIAGPVAVLGMQEMLARSLPDWNQDDLDSHPFPPLRPLVQTQILRYITDRNHSSLFAQAPEILDAHWQQWVKNYWPHWVNQCWPYGYSSNTDILRAAKYKINGNLLTGKQILDALEPLIKVVLEALEDVRPARESDTWSNGWNPKEQTDQNQLNALYDCYADFVQQTVFNLNADFEPILHPQDEAPTAQSLGKWLDYRREQLANSRSKNPGIDDLVDLILFQGWSTDGPQSVGGH